MTNDSEAGGRREPAGPDGRGEQRAHAGCPPGGALLGVDYGTVRVGFSVCDPDRIIASPLETYTRRTEQLDAAHVVKACADHRVVALVVGLPIHSNGDESDSSRAARAYGAWLAGLTGLPVVFWDERFSTTRAEEALLGAKLSHKSRREKRDRVAAQMILQTYLDAGCPPAGTETGPRPAD